MSGLSFDKFVEVTYVVAAGLEGEGYIPSYVDVNAQRILALEGVPTDVDMKVAALDWAISLGNKDYFLGYQVGEEIVLENYVDGHVSETVNIEIPNTRIQ